MRVQLVVSGRVQGVGFRYATMRQALQLDITGWVRNTRDGRVEILAEGTAAAIGQFVEWARRGPVGAAVAKVDQTYLESGQPFRDFQIR